MEVVDSLTHQTLIKAKTFENPHPFLFIFIDCIEPITVRAYCPIDCSHDVTLPNGKLIGWCMVSLQ